MRISKLFLGNRLQEWRETEFRDAALVLHQLATDLIEQAEAEIDTLSKRQLVTGQATYLSRQVSPQIRSAAEPVMLRLVEKANRSLQELVAHNAVWGERPTDGASDPAFDGWQDVALAAAPFAGGVAVAAALPAVAVTTTTFMFGLITTTAISWPVVVGGGVLAGGLIATGAWNTSQLADRFRQRLRRKAREHIWSSLIAGSKSPSLLEQFNVLLGDTVKQARRA